MYTIGHYRCTVCEMLTLVCTEHTSTTSPVDGTQEYHYWHEIKSTDQVWDFRDDVCRNESRESMKCVQLANTDVQYVNTHTRMYGTHFNHIASRWNTGVSLLA